jgi:hypothetical protein
LAKQPTTRAPGSRCFHDGHIVEAGTERLLARSINQTPECMQPDCSEREEMEAKSLMIGVLAVAVAVLGYLYWDSQQSGVEINVPGVSIKAK